MATVKLGDTVKVLDNAFGDSTDPDDVAARGKIGKVTWVFGDGRIEVQAEPDDDFLPLTIDEVEVIEAGESEGK